jgi:uncharacterized CHY-type Zn-finger protein
MRANLETGLKVCSKCRVEQPIANFHRHARSADGLYPQCKECNITTAAAWYAKNSEAARQRSREWQAKNPDKVRAIKRRWEAKNLEAVRQKSREWYAKNPEAARQSRREWRAKNPGKVLANARRRTYGISPEDVIALRKAQGGKCPGCLREFSSLFRDHVDHDHATGRIRGILCSNCNSGMGLLKDDPEILLRLAAYLRAAKSVNLQQK